MALDQNIKDTVIADVEYFNHKHKKGEKIGVEGGMSRKLEALKRELQAVNPPQSEDKELARKWVASFPLDDLEGDDTAKGKIRILKEEVGKGVGSPPNTPSATAAASTPTPSLNIPTNGTYPTTTSSSPASKTSAPSAVPVAAPAETPAVTTSVETPYPDKQKAFAEAISSATTFPIVIRWTEGGRSYEVNMSADKNMISIGGKKITLTHSNASVEEVKIDKDKFYAKGRENILGFDKDGWVSIEKSEFIRDILPALLSLTATGTVRLKGQDLIATVVGTESPKSIETPKKEVDKKTLETLQAIKTRLDKNLKLGTSPLDLKQDLATLAKESDPRAKQMGLNLTLNHLGANGYALQIIGGKVNVVPTSGKGTQEQASGYELTINSSLQAGEVSRANIEESIVMMTGEKWSEYAQLTKPEQTSSAGYAAYLLDRYTSKESIPQGSAGMESYIRNHRTMSPTEKTFLLSHYAGQMSSVNMPQVAGNYLEALKAGESIVNSGVFQALGAKLGMQPLSPAQANAVAAAAARGDGAGMDRSGGYGMTALFGALSLFLAGWFTKGGSFGRGFKWLLGGIGGYAMVNIGCAAGKEIKAGGHIDMDLCKEAKGWLKGMWDDVRGSSGSAPSATPAAASTAAASTTAQPAASAAATPTAAPASSFDTSKLNTEQKKIYSKLSSTEALVSQINTAAEGNKKANKAETGDFNAYMSYIFSDKIQTLSLDKLIYTSNPQNGVFGNAGSVDLALGVPNKLDNNTLKYILREYLIGRGSLEVVSGKPQGQKEREEFEVKYSSASWGSKTLDDITKEIHK